MSLKEQYPWYNTALLHIKKIVDNIVERNPDIIEKTVSQSVGLL